MANMKLLKKSSGQELQVVP